ncbi:sensor histidine kinase [Pelagicoccus sp. SDUM812005]|uniref:sensor histidine kinase n=1 Tax=Pelagicoccus sp. SDUM812005 TaxID=3041257 RepID=UPI0028107049|nr:sensor histidine kinase [Pelagicoccus sp. SDUM812005]MDQ8181026.1 sensor histidine kinase [Pelagicoccus sp. SDUM812005]
MPYLNTRYTYPLPPLSLLLALAAVLILPCQPTQAQTPAPEPLFTTAAEIRALSPEEAAKQHPIRLRGCYMAQETHSFSMQDETDGIFIFTSSTSVDVDFKRGDRVEVIGYTNAGDYAPCVTATSVRLIGKASVPDPIPTTLAELYFGQMDAKWVELEGIVRRVEILPNILQKPPEALTPDGENLYTKLKLVSGNLELVIEMQELLDPSKYLDAKIRVVGHCFYLHNGNRQFVRPILHTPMGIVPDIIQPPVYKSFDTPPRPVSSLFTFDPSGGNPGHRVHVKGVVTHQRPGKALWIRDDKQSLRIQSSQDEALVPGDIVSVLGFPTPGTYSPVLQDATFKKRGNAPRPAPVELSELNMITRHDSDLIRLTATLLEVQRYPESIELTLQGLGTTVRASLISHAELDSLPDWRPGSTVSVSGIATVGEGETIPLNGLWWSESLHLLLRSPSDLTILTPAPWWTPQRIAYGLAGVLLLAIATIALIVLFSRRRLREQKQQRAMAESEFSAILTERNRVAREIHDTLAQNIGAISVHLELVRPDVRDLKEDAQKHIQTAHKLARTALTDARDSIWNMRSQVLEKHDLGGALERIALQLVEDSDIEASVSVSGNRRRLPPVVENNLLRVGQEAVTNAIKHAKPQKIEIHISYHNRRIELVVQDDGQGFDQEKTCQDSKKSFGLVGIRERVELLDGEVDIQSTPGKGTRIRVEVSD